MPKLELRAATCSSTVELANKIAPKSGRNQPKKLEIGARIRALSSTPSTLGFLGLKYPWKFLITPLEKFSSCFYMVDLRKCKKHSKPADWHFTKTLENSLLSPLKNNSKRYRVVFTWNIFWNVKNTRNPLTDTLQNRRKNWRKDGIFGIFCTAFISTFHSFFWIKKLLCVFFGIKVAEFGSKSSQCVHVFFVCVYY